MDDDPLLSGNGNYVSVREFAAARAKDRREIEHQAEFAALAVEERLMRLFSDHMTNSRESHRAMDDRQNRLSEGIDGIKSIIDQQRGAKNLIVIFGVGTIINIAVSVIAVLVR